MPSKYLDQSYLFRINHLMFMVTEASSPLRGVTACADANRTSSGMG